MANKKMQNKIDPVVETAGYEDPSVVLPTVSAVGEDEKMRRKGMLDDLMNQFNEIENIQRGVNSNNFSNKNKLDQLRVDLIQKLFQIMTQAGVDPSDLNSIRKFLMDLEKTNPDLYMLFEDAFNTLMPADMGMPQEGMPGTTGASPLAAATAPPMPPAGMPEMGGVMPTPTEEGTMPTPPTSPLNRFRNLGQ